jgi:hypothetical protein
LPCLLARSVASSSTTPLLSFFFSPSTSPYGAMADSFPAFDLNVRIEDDDDRNLPFDLNEQILEDQNNGGNVSVVTQFVLFFYDIHSWHMQISLHSKFVLFFT